MKQFTIVGFVALMLGAGATVGWSQEQPAPAAQQPHGTIIRPSPEPAARKVRPASELSGSEIPAAEAIKPREIHPKELNSPFPLDVKTPSPKKLDYLAPAAMSTADRDLVTVSENEIVRRAALVGFRLDGQTVGQGSGDSGWGYEQAVCPVFPQHLILEYSRSNGAGDVSLFSVVIPRGGEGHVRVIPAQRRSYSLWTPVAGNTLTINDFNHMVAEEHTGLSPQWLTLGLCYSAMASGHVRASLLPVKIADEVYPLYPPAMLRVGNPKNGAEVLFSDSSSGKKSTSWFMTFASDGRLLKVKRSEAYVVRERPVAGQVLDADEIDKGGK